jgi:hypothetical protein
VNSTEDSAPPKLFEHVLRVFAEMRRHAVPQMTPDAGEESHVLVYEGYLTHLFRDLGLPTPYYSSVMDRLKVMGCVRQLSRGGGSSPSRWELLQDPDFEDFQAAEDSNKKAPSRQEQLERYQAVMDRRLQKVERMLGVREDEEPEQEAASG